MCCKLTQFYFSGLVKVPPLTLTILLVVVTANQPTQLASAASVAMMMMLVHQPRGDETEKERRREVQLEDWKTRSVWGLLISLRKAIDEVSH